MQKNRLKTILKIVLIIVLFVCINLTNGGNRRVTVLEEIVSDVVTLPQRLAVNVKNFFKEDGNIFFENIETLKEQNDELKKENEELQKKALEYEILLTENELLKKHIKLSDLYPNYSVIVADIIMDSGMSWDYTYTINRGSKDGIEPNMAVIAEDGLVGYIESVTRSTAKVVSILDAGNSISARVTRTRDTVISKGSIALSENMQMRITNIPTGVTLVEGDKIETSGLGGIYPKGILIGKIKSFTQKNNPIENEAIVESFVDFNKLETVAVIKNNVEE